MRIRIERRWKKDSYTIGRIFIDGEYICNSMEDTDRGLTATMEETDILKAKVYGRTAIPTGLYDILLTYSPKFANKQWAKKYKGVLPLVKGVKGFSGIRIHPGNTDGDTLGCILPGVNTQVGKVLNSTFWFQLLMDKYIMPAHARKELITIEII